MATCSEDGTSKIIELDTEKELHALAPKTGALNLIDYSNDGSRFITGSYDGTVKLWDTTAWEEVWSVHAHDSMVWTGRFSPDGIRLAVSDFRERVVRVYVLPIDELVALIKARVTRSLTTDECKVYLHMEECPTD